MQVKVYLFSVLLNCKRAEKSIIFSTDNDWAAPLVKELHDCHDGCHAVTDCHARRTVTRASRAS